MVSVPKRTRNASASRQLGGVITRPSDAVPLGLMARWAAASRDGDMVGGDFPAWLPDLVGKMRTRGLADVCLVLLNTNEFAYVD